MRRSDLGLPSNRCRSVRQRVLESKRNKSREFQSPNFFRCDACAHFFPLEVLDVDHVIPFSVGGDDSATASASASASADGQENFLVLDANCHRLKTSLERAVRQRIEALPPSASLCWGCGRIFSLYFSVTSHLFCEFCASKVSLHALVTDVRQSMLVLIQTALRRQETASTRILLET